MGKESTCNAEDAGRCSLIPELERPLEEGMATYSSILAWRIPWAEKPGRLESRGSQRARQLKQLGTHKHIVAHFVK